MKLINPTPFPRRQVVLFGQSRIFAEPDAAVPVPVLELPTMLLAGHESHGATLRARARGTR